MKLDGLSKGIPLSSFDQEELHRGALVEREHTSDPAIAMRIAADHLVEDPLYYRKLARMERNPAAMDEPVVSEHGEICTIKDHCVVICETSGPVVNAPRVYSDHAKLKAAYDAVRGATEQIHGWTFAEAVHRTLVKLPVRYNARLTRAIGRAKFKNIEGGAVATEIELTAAYEIPESYMHRLLVHEGCHVARSVIEPVGFNHESPHGRDWQLLMVGAGEKPEATCIDPSIAAQARARVGHPAPEQALSRSDISVGDRVSFIAGKKRGRVVAWVIEKSASAAVVRNDDGDRWRVGYGLLTKEPTP